MKIGLVDLDTSHPPSWIPIERELGHEIAGVWDGGDVHPAGYAAKFAEEHSIPKVYETIEEMVSDVDCAIIHGCNWDTHIEKARPFVQAGKSVLFDKPMASRWQDLQQIRAWAQQGARIAGGSSLRFAYEVQEWFAQPQEERGTPDTVLCGCGVDEFNYGIHAYSMLAGILGGGAQRVRHLGEGVQRRVQVDWADGRTGIIVMGTAANWLPFYTTIVTEKSINQFQADSSRLYRALLEKNLPYLAGETPQAPVSINDLLEPEIWALAAKRSRDEKGRFVELSELAEGEGYDGAEFANGYKLARYPESQ